jgi:hypothetical protein
MGLMTAAVMSKSLAPGPCMSRVTQYHTVSGTARCRIVELSLALLTAFTLTPTTTEAAALSSVFRPGSGGL